MDGVAVDVVDGVAVDVDAVGGLADSEQATSANVIVTTSSVVPQRITRDRRVGSCVDRERVQFAVSILLLRLRDRLSPQPLLLSSTNETGSSYRDPKNIQYWVDRCTHRMISFPVFPIAGEYTSSG
jgi:hypothetical protein